MHYGPVTNLPVSRGPVTYHADGSVKVGRYLEAHPFSQPQPYFVGELPQGGIQQYTTNGVAMLLQAAGPHLSEPVLVRAGLNVFCALIITPGGLTLADFADGMRGGRDDRLIWDIPRDGGSLDAGKRFGLPGGSRVSFFEGYDGIRFAPTHEFNDEVEQHEWR